MKLNKKLGQHFFKNEPLAREIVSTIKADIKSILEIGPGDGFFTSLILERFPNASYTGIDIDAEMVANLKIKFKEYKNANFQHQDILNIHKNGIEDIDFIYSSLPYNISIPIIKLLLKESQIPNMLFIIQREVGEKYTQHLQDANILSLTAKLHGEFKYLKTIKPGSFTPPPKVDSALISFSRYNKAKFSEQFIKKFEEIVNSAFSKPRKTLQNNLVRYNVGLEYKTLRPHQLSFDNYIDITNLNL